MWGLLQRCPWEIERESQGNHVTQDVWMYIEIFTKSLQLFKCRIQNLVILLNEITHSRFDEFLSKKAG